MSASFCTEPLESRLFLSANPLSTAVQADQLQIRQELLQFQSDFVSSTILLTADVNAIKADDVKAAKTLTPLIAKFHADVSAMCAQLKADCLAEQQNVLTDEAGIAGDQLKILTDKGNATKEAADHTKLLTDRIHLQNDMITGLNTRLATRNADCTQIFADGNAIVAAAMVDPGASPKLVADLTKWNTDKQNSLETFEDDLADVIADRTQLVVDLTAMLIT